MAKPKVFISFDYDHDDDLKVLLVGQAKHSDTPFELADWSIKEAIDGNWKTQARKRIRAVDVVVVCGEHTDTATGVGAELAIAQGEKIRYFSPARVLGRGRQETQGRQEAQGRLDHRYGLRVDLGQPHEAGGNLR